jgi:hypothetical protein
MALRLIYFASAVLTAVAVEADVGIGVSAKSDEATAYIPITAGRFMFEPYFRSSDKEDQQGTTAHTESNSLGIGIFRLVEPAERVTVYYGGRLARLEEKQWTEQRDGDVFATTEREGHSIVPSIGFQYHVIERFSVGAELGVQRGEVQETVTQYRTIFVPGPPSDVVPGPVSNIDTSKASSTETKVEFIVRFLF